MKEKKKFLFVIVAPSGTGKSTLISRIRESFPQLSWSVSYTSRDKRPGEVDGKDYFFISEEEFQHRIDNNEFIEWALVHQQYKGTSKLFLQDKIEDQVPILLDLDVQGTEAVKEAFPQESIAIFIEPPSLTHLEERLRGRGTETEKNIELRLKNAEIELQKKNSFDYLVCNDEIDQAYDRLVAIFQEYLG